MIRNETQALLDGFASAGLLAYVLVLVLRRTGGPLTPRLIFLFGLMCVFYGVRSLAVTTGLEIFEGATFAVIALAPLAVLLLAEGLLRRHAPWQMKMALFVASSLALGFALFTTSHAAFGSRIGLAVMIIASLVAVLILLWTRDRHSLSPVENDSVRRLALGLAVVIPLIATDFSALIDSPIGFSPIAVLVIILLALSNGVSDARDVWIEAGVVLLAAFALTFGLVERLDIQPLEDRIRLFSLVIAALITMTLVVRVQPFGAAGRQTGLRRRLIVIDARSSDAFIDALAKEPMLKDMSVLTEPDLQDYPIDAITGALGGRALWSFADLHADDADIKETEREPLLDLLTRADATHIGLLSQLPLRIGMVRLPELLRGTEAEIDLSLAFRMARLTSEHLA